MIRRLNPYTDITLYRQCWGWYEALPEWARETLVDSVETFEEFLELARANRADIGVFDQDRMVAVITLELVASGVYELHLSSIRRPPVKLILGAMVNVIKIAFEELDARVGFSFTPSYDQGIIRMVRAVGLRQDGVEKLRCTSKGKVVRWIRSIITRADYESNTKTESDPDGLGSIFANGVNNADHNPGSEHARHRAA